MFLFQFKLMLSKASKVKQFTGTWAQFENKYPTVIIVAVPQPVIEG